MHIKIEILRQAVSEAAEARLWYEQRSVSSAKRFLRAFDRAIEAIIANPNRWPKGIRQTRRYRLSRFPFAIIYIHDEKLVQIIAVAHLKRCANYWRKRPA